MTCLTCKSGEMEEGHATYFAEGKDCIVVIKNVPCMKCEQCGEEIFNTVIIDKIDEIVKAAEKMASEISIIDYTKVA